MFGRPQWDQAQAKASGETLSVNKAKNVAVFFVVWPTLVVGIFSKKMLPSVLFALLAGQWEPNLSRSSTQRFYFEVWHDPK